jgi:hypothetical protein
VSESERRDAAPLVLLALAIVVVVAASVARRLLDHLSQLAGRPAAASLASALLCFALAAFAARLVVTRRALDRRVALLAVPADAFDPGEDAVIAFASALARSRRALRGFLDSPASGVRLRLDADEAGRLRYLIEVPRHATAALRVGLAAYGEVELRPAPGAPTPTEGVEVARAELVPARRSSEPLRRAGLDPDPLAGLARAIDGLDAEVGESAAVCVDLLPVPAGRRRRMRRRLLRQARRGGRFSAETALDELLGGAGRRSRGGAADPAETVARRMGRQGLDRKLGTDEPLFELQILVRVASPVAGRAKARLAALLAAFDTFAGENHLRVSGVALPGLVFLGSDLRGRRGRFDRRFASGLFRPARRRVVTAGEIAGLLKPPSVRCAPTNVLRAGAAVGPPPRRLPTFRGQADLMPIGKVTGEEGERIVGVPLADTFFSYMAGRSRFGKTETALGQLVHLARSGHGCLLLDPHHDGIERVKPYLTEDGVRGRVVEVDLTDAARQPAWNLLSAAGRSPARAAGQVDAVVDAFASALRWDEVNARALNLTTQSVQALADLSRSLPPELAPTIFEIPVLLSDDGWRAAVMPHVSEPVRRFFENRFPRLSPEAVTPVTNLVDRLRASPAAAALLGNPAAGYDVRAAMDRGQIVLICPGWGSTRDRLIANFALFDALHAARSRAELAVSRRRPFHVFFDEAQIYDGASSGTLAALLEQAAKFGVRAMILNQSPERLSAATRDAVLTNRSHLLTTALDAGGSALLARELGHGITGEAVASLARYHSLASVTIGGEISPPFRLAGVPLEGLFPAGAVPEQVAALDAAIARSSGHVPAAATLDRLDEHPRAILAHLAAGRRRPGGRSGTQTVGGLGGGR